VDVFFNRHHTYWYKLCSSSGQRVPVFAWGRLHTGASQEKRTEASQILQFHLPLSRLCPFAIFLALWFRCSHLSHWAWNKNIRRMHISLLHTLSYTSKLTVGGGQERNFTTQEIISIFPLWTPFICSNIPAAPAYWVYISQLIRYSRACGFYLDFLNRGFMLTRKLLNQGLSFRTFYSKVDHYGISVSQMTMAMFHLS